MTASTTAYAQFSPPSTSSPSEGEFTVNEQNRVTGETIIRNVTQGYRKAISQRIAARQRAAKKFGGQEIREDTDTAFTNPYFFGPRLDGFESGMDGVEPGMPAGGARSGIAAGESANGIGTFANFSLTHSESTAGGFKTDTGLGVISAGVDKAFQDNFIVGMTVSGAWSDDDSDFEVGGGKFTSSNTSDTYSFAPYMAIILNENYYIDATVGVSQGENRIHHTNAVTGAIVQTGDADYRSQFLSTGVNYTNTVFGDYGLQLSASYTWASYDRDDFIDNNGTDIIVNDNRTSQLILGGQIGRQVDNLTPYVLAYYERDLIKAPRGGGIPGEEAADGRNALRLGAGVDAVVMDSLTVSGEVNTLLFKPGYNEYGLALNIRYDF
jgi:outer membrane autotransporter protein